MTTTLTKDQEEYAIVLTDRLTALLEFIGSDPNVQNEVIRRLTIEFNNDFFDDDDKVTVAVMDLLRSFIRTSAEWDEEAAAAHAAAMEELIPSTIQLQPE